MRPEEMHDPRSWWYGAREEDLIRGLTAVDEVYDSLGDLQQRDLLEMVLPGILEIGPCWGEVSDILGRLRSLDGYTAVDILRERGEFSGLTMNRADAEDQVRGELIVELRDVFSRYVIPRATVGQVALMAVVR